MNSAADLDDGACYAFSESCLVAYFLEQSGVRDKDDLVAQDLDLEYRTYKDELV